MINIWKDRLVWFLFNCNVSSMIGVGSLAVFRVSTGILFGNLNFCRTWKSQTENKLQMEYKLQSLYKLVNLYYTFSLLPAGKMLTSLIFLMDFSGCVRLAQPEVEFCNLFENFLCLNFRALYASSRTDTSDLLLNNYCNNKLKNNTLIFIQPQEKNLLFAW